MSTRTAIAFAAALLACMTLTGCVNDENPISDEQFAQWNAQADSTIPDLDVDVAPDVVTTMTGSRLKSIDITATFTDFDTLNANTDALVALESDIRSASQGIDVRLEAQLESADDVQDRLSNTLTDSTPGVQEVFLSFDGSYVLRELKWSSHGGSVVGVTNPSVVTPEWLDNFATTAASILEPWSISASWLRLQIETASTSEGDPDIATLPGIQDSLNPSGCLYTESWVFTFADDEAYPHANAPIDGRCG